MTRSKAGRGMTGGETPDAVADSLARLLKNLGGEKSRKGYANDWGRYRTWLAFEGVDVTEAKPRHVEDHLIYLREHDGDVRSTCSRALSVIREVYRILVRDEIMEVNPAREVKNPKFDSSPSTPYLNEAQVKQLLAMPATTWWEKRDRMCLRLALGLGWRRSEIARLCVEDFKDGAATAVRKGGKVTAVGVPPFLMKQIETWLAFAGITTGPVLPRAPHRPKAITGDIVYKIVTKSCERAGVPRVSPHGLRRSFTSILHNNGTDLRSLQIALSHSSIVTTERYSKAADALKNIPGEGMAYLLGED